MKRFTQLTLSVLVLASLFSCKQNNKELTAKTATDANGYSYEYVSNDDSKTRLYTLENGLKVYLSVYKEKPRIHTYMPVKAGGKFDPENSTGLAHYLEHMLFKGNSQFGTKDWEKEKPLLDSIENMFQHYRTLTDVDERKAWYKKIDEVSNEASKFAIANEYDKLVQYIGASGTNAYTTEDRTVYVNDIPSNQLENWLQIESTRFREITNRLFHTELEAVYEEKNRSLDNDGWKVYENLYKLAFQKHKYGTQTVIGTIEHLKNPSITDINNYFYKYYIPNNMAICMSGDLDPEATIKMVDQYFGSWEKKELEEYVVTQEDPITSPRETTVLGPDSENLSMAFRFGGTASDDIPKVLMIDYLLANSSAGLIDLNLVQKQKVLSAGSYVDQLNDYSLHNLYGKPREGQSLIEVRDLILEQIELIKKGAFEEWLLEAVVNEFKKNKMRSLERNASRTNAMVMAFTNDMSWKDYLSQIERMEAITKEDLVKFANERYSDNYAIVYKKTGEDKDKQKVEKPSITKVDLDRSARSPFFQSIVDNKVPGIQPVFVDYEKDVQELKMKSDIPVLYKKNEENQIYTLYYLLETGTNENPKLSYALNFLSYLGTDTKSAEEVKKAFYKLGANFNVSSSNERVYVFLSGLNSTMEPALKLFEELLANPKVESEEVLANMVSDAHKKRSDNKKSKNAILWSGLQNYARYGEDSPFTNTLSNEELNALAEEELIALLKSIPSTEHLVMYYGPMSSSEVIDVLNENRQVPEKLNPAPERKVFAELDTKDPQVYWADYDMVQAEILFQSKGPIYDYKIAPEVTLFNEYFGGMSGLAFQEIREAQGLAYSVFAGYNQGTKKDRSNMMMAYVGTQVDKQEEAMNALITLINEMPESKQSFENAKKAILENLESQRVTKTSVFFNYLDAKGKDLKYDIRKDIYTKVKEMSFADLRTFHDKHIKGNSYNVALVGDKDRLDFKALSKYGKVQELSLEKLFGYDENAKPVAN